MGSNIETTNTLSCTNKYSRAFKACLMLSWLSVTAGCAQLNASGQFSVHPLPEGVIPPSSYVSLQPNGALYAISTALDETSIQRSSAVQEVRAAQARLLARGYGRFPQITPASSLDIGGNNSPTFGVNLEQMIWDAGRTQVRISDGELGIAEASLRAWTTRNEDIYEGLSAFINMSRYRSQLTTYNRLEVELEGLKETLGIRAAGGVSDRSEILRVNISLQELRRDIVTTAASMEQSHSDFVRFLPDGANYPPLQSIASTSGICSRSWTNAEPPLDALARVTVSRMILAEGLTRAQRFPRIVLNAGATTASVAASATPGVSLQLDASDMLGLDGRGRVEAARLDSEAAVADYEAQRADTLAELERLEASYNGYLSSLQQLEALQPINNDTLNLYREQLDVGSISLIEGISIFREITDTEIEMSNFQADIIINCLQSSQFRGTLAPFLGYESPTLQPVVFELSVSR